MIENLVNGKERLIYIDAVKGFAILLVVMGHVIGFCFQMNSFILYTINLFHMPLFFFASGLLTKDLTSLHKGQSFNINSKFILAKIRALIIPFLVVGSLFLIYRDKSFSWFWFNQYKGGYWFLFTLFQLNIFILFFFNISKALNRRGIFWKDILFVLVIFLILKLVRHIAIIPNSINDLIGYNIMVNNYIFIFLGVIIKKHNLIDSILKNDLLYAFSFLVFFIKLFFCDTILLNNEYLNIVVGICCSLLFTSFFYRLSDNYIFKNQLIVFGRQSLEIYIFHYFFIFALILPQSGVFFNQNNLSVFEIILVVFFSIVIIFLSLFVSKIISQSKYLRLFVLGKKDSLIITKF